MTWRRINCLAALVDTVLTLASCAGGVPTAKPTPFEKACGNQVATEAGYRVTSWSPMIVKQVVAHPKAMAADT